MARKRSTQQQPSSRNLTDLFNQSPAPNPTPPLQPPHKRRHTHKEPAESAGTRNAPKTATAKTKANGPTGKGMKGRGRKGNCITGTSQTTADSAQSIKDAFTVWTADTDSADGHGNVGIGTQLEAGIIESNAAPEQPIIDGLDQIIAELEHMTGRRCTSPPLDIGTHAVLPGPSPLNDGSDHSGTECQSVDAVPVQADAVLPGPSPLNEGSDHSGTECSDTPYQYHRTHLLQDMDTFTMPTVPPPPPTLHNLKDVFNWPLHFLTALSSCLPSGLASYLLQTLFRFTYSTAFSGVDAPGTALCQIIAELEHMTGRRCTSPPQHCHGIECDAHCRAELNAHPHAPSCLYSDVNDFWDPQIRLKLEAQSATESGLSWDNHLVPVILSDKCVHRHAPCCKHIRRSNGARKFCVAKTCKIHWAGVPCWDFSPQGQQQGVKGPTAMAVAAWYATRRLIQEPIVVFENSDRYPASVLEQLLGDIYVVMPYIVVSTVTGALSYRSRLWALLAHREFCTKIWASMSNVIPLFTRILGCTWRCILDERYLLGASHEEQQYELYWASNRPTSGVVGSPVDRSRVGPWEEALSKTEFSYLCGYEQLAHFQPGCAMHLHQNPKTHPQYSKAHRYLMCLISSQNIVFCSDETSGSAGGTWLCPSEAFAVLGFPTHTALSKGVRCCSMAHPSGSRMFEDSGASLAGPKGDFAPYVTRRRALLHMSGNTMDVSVCGAHWLYALIFLQRLDHEFM